MPNTFGRTLGFALAATLYGCAVPPPGEALPPVAAVPPNDTLCRTITTTADIDGQPQTVRGTACRQPDGTWRTDASPQAAVVYPGPYADYYDDGWYGAAPVTVVGGGFVFFDGFHHHPHGFHGGGFHDHGFHEHGGFHGGGFHSGGMHAWAGGGMHGGRGGGRR